MHLVMLRHFAWLPWRDHAKELGRLVKSFTQLNCQLVLVSFGTPTGALRWFNENQIGLDMITDEKRVLYKLFDLKVSYSKVWRTDTLVYYAEQLSLQRQLPKAYQDVEDDPHQMGGNFVIEFNSSNQTNSLKTVFSYRSANPSDRPRVNDLLHFLKKNN